MVRIGNPQGNPYGGGHPYQPYGQPGMYGPPGGLPPQRPRGSRIKPILGWVGVVIGGVLSTVLASYIIDAVTEDDTEKGKTVASPAGTPLPEGWEQPLRAEPYTNGPKIRATGDTSTWPSACDLFTDAELVNALPGSRVLPTRKGHKYDGVTLKPPPFKPIGCAIELSLPNLTSAMNPAKITVAIEAIGDPVRVREVFEDQKAEDTTTYAVTDSFEDLENRLYVQSAYRGGTTLHLLKGNYYLSLDLKADTKDTQGMDVPRTEWPKKVGAALVQVLDKKMTDSDVAPTPTAGGGEQR